MQIPKPDARRTSIRAIMFLAMAVAAFFNPWLALLIPAVLALLEYGHRGGLHGEQRVKFRWMLGGGFVGAALHMTLNTIFTMPVIA